jgi:hypothetical protein
MRRHPAEVVLGLGFLLRVWAYLLNRSYWMDEGSLLGNLVGVRVFDFSSHLSGDQLAPIGFLVVERIVISLLGDSGYATRLLPLICGLVSLWLFAKLAARVLSAPAALVALILFALSDDLVYYSSELKPYSSDLAIILAITLLCLKSLDQPLGNRRTAILALFAVVAPWFSFPSAFAIAGCGAALAIERIGRGWWRDVGRLAIVGACWALSFVFSYTASHALLSGATTMYIFWNFAFLPFPPRATADLATAGGILLEVFVNPLNMLPRSLPPYVVAVPLAILLVGAFALAARDRSVFLILVMPVVLALIAAAMRRFPFHGRLILELMPAFFLMMAETADLVRARLGRIAYRVVLAVLLFYPCMSTLYELSAPRERYFNSHGDLHHNRFVE